MFGRAEQARFGSNRVEIISVGPVFIPEWKFLSSNHFNIMKHMDEVIELD